MVALAVPIGVTEHVVAASTGLAACVTPFDIDPLTGLLGYPFFEREFSTFVESEQSIGPISVAIGDVDDLKIYVESENLRVPNNFGHLAGNAIMRRLGVLVRARVMPRLATVDWWALATFGGDEVIIAARAPPPHVALGHR